MQLSYVFAKFYLILIFICLIYVDQIKSDGELLEQHESEASIGCPIPDLRLSRPKIFSQTTEQPYVTYIETTQLYLPEDLTTTDFNSIENIEQIENLSENTQRLTRYTDFNPYAWGDSIDGGDGGQPMFGGTTIIDDQHYDELTGNQQSQHNKQQNFKNERRKPRKNSSGRRRLDRHNQGHKQSKREIKVVTSNKKIYHVQSLDDIIKLQNFYEKLNKTSTNESDVNNTKSNGQQQHHHQHRRRRRCIHGRGCDQHRFISNENIEEDIYNHTTFNDTENNIIKQFNNTVDENVNDAVAHNIENEDANGLQSNNDTINIRTKRKSGKTTGALRPKTGSEASSKTPSRKKEGSNVDEDGGHYPHSTDDSEDGSEESEESESIEVNFNEVTEVRFPGEVGPLGDRRLCKIRCVKGKWVGPLCASTEEDENGQLRFQPLYKSCLVNRIQPHLLLSYRNISVNIGWNVPHGHSLQARCKDLGLYKLLGETKVLCSNGLWTPRMPSCVPTTLLTNYSDDSPPSIRIKIGIGSGAFEPSGVFAVLPASTIHLDCMYPRRRGTPEWTTTGWFRSYYIGWSNIPEEKSTKYRLTINDIQTHDSGTFTCTSPRGLTNSIVIIVAMSNCPQHPDPVPPLTLRLEGLQLGQRALYTCPLGYTIDGAPNSTCLASGNWSSPPPTCHPVQCPPLFLEDPHLSLTELNTSAWGRAVFKCSWGYRLSGPPGLECEPSGIWNGPVPRCKAIQCLQPLVPINGRIDGTSGATSHRRYAVGALVTFSCTDGHLLEGEASIVCTETGVWSHPPPFCKSQCPYPGDPPNGLIAPLKFHYDPGDYLSVQCRPGFIEFGSNGPPERPHCLPGGNWSGPVPQCRNYADV